MLPDLQQIRVPDLVKIITRDLKLITKPGRKPTGISYLANAWIARSKKNQDVTSGKDWGARSKTDKYARSGFGPVTRSESDPPARSGRLCMLPLMLIWLRSGKTFASFKPDLYPVILPDLI